MTAQENIVVVGAGIVGVSSAIWLQRSGQKVTLVDRSEPGEGTSFGNGGVLANSGVMPITSPGMIPKGPKMLFDPNFPLFLRWSYLPKLAPWLIKYLSHANEKDARRISAGLAPIVGSGVEEHNALSQGTKANAFIRQGDYTFAYPSRKDFEADAFAFELRAKAGFAPEIIEGPAVHDYEPALGRDVKLLAVMKHHGHIRNPGGYVKALAEVFQAEGGRFLQAEVKDFTLNDGGVTAVVTNKETLPCDKVVLASGVWSKKLCQKLGLNVPLETERGYHILFKNPSFELKHPLMITAGKFVATPMDMGLRCAGIVEFGGLEAGPSKAPIKLLLKVVKETFPSLTYDGTEEWLGHRPAPSDSLPLIGEIAATGVYTAFGHHHIGLTAGPKTGRLIADLITQKGTNIDMSPYSPNRFNKHNVDNLPIKHRQNVNSELTMAENQSSVSRTVD